LRPPIDAADVARVYGAYEDVKEEALLYTHLLRGPIPAAQIESLRETINEFLRKRFGIDIAFDIHDALGRLRAQGLVQDSPSGDLRAMPLREASRHLYDRWCAALGPN